MSRWDGDPLDRIKAKTPTWGTDGCWIWTGTIAVGPRAGYGQFRVNYKRWAVHRYVYTRLVGEIPEGLVIDHTCHNDDPTCPGGPCLHRLCMNPAHMEPVTSRENTMRGKTLPVMYAARTHCKYGHDITDPANHRGGPGGRVCRICNNDRITARRQHEREQKQAVSD